MSSCDLPRVTVLMPVYNAGVYLSQAIESVLQQTFTDFEFLIIDDGSTDDSYKIASAFSDARIRLIRLDRNMGLVNALNLGLNTARGEFIARMDADDISLPDRLSKQVHFLDVNPAIAVCGTWLKTFAETKNSLWAVPLNHDAIHARLLFGSAVFHATVLMRKALLNEHVLRYVEGFPYAEDYELWSRCVLTCRLANMSDVLYYYRIHNNSAGNSEPDSKQHSADLIRLRWLQQAGVKATDEEMILHRQLSLGRVPLPLSVAYIEKIHAWLMKIRDANMSADTFPEVELLKELSDRWFWICNQSTPLGLTAVLHYFRSPLSSQYSGRKRAVFAFMIKSILRWPGR